MTTEPQEVDSKPLSEKHVQEGFKTAFTSFKELHEKPQTKKEQETTPVFILISIEDLIQVSNRAKEPDFYVWVKGSEKKLGKPTRKRESKTSQIAIKCNRMFLVPMYLYYVCKYVHNSGGFVKYAKGTISLKHIRKGDVLLAIVDGLKLRNPERTK